MPTTLHVTTFAQSSFVFKHLPLVLVWFLYRYLLGFLATMYFANILHDSFFIEIVHLGFYLGIFRGCCTVSLNSFYLLAK